MHSVHLPVTQAGSEVSHQSGHQLGRYTVCVILRMRRRWRRRRTQCHTDQYDWLVSTVHVLQTNACALIGEEKAVEEAII